VARHVEDVGFDFVSVADHLVYVNRLRTAHPDGGKPPLDPNLPRPDSWVLLTFVAAHTSKLRLRTGIYLAPLRSPLVTAKAIATVDWLSGGRVTVGLGAGWLREEFEILQVPFEERGARLDEYVEIMRMLWSGRPDFRGRFVSYQNVIFEPCPAQRSGSAGTVMRPCGAWSARAMAGCHLVGISQWIRCGDSTHRQSNPIVTRRPLA
jgi:probable F420-dependent oxidoreductase